MAKVMRVGDTFSGSCPIDGPTTGTVTSTSSTTTADGKAIVRVGDVGVAICGHTFTVTTGSSLGTDSGKSICRVGDQAQFDINPVYKLTAQSGSPTIDVS